MQTDLVIAAVRDVATGPLAGLVKQLTGEPDLVLSALRHVCYQELSFRNGLAPRPEKFDLPACTERELLVTGLACTGSAEVLPDEPGCALWLAVARLCGEQAAALRSSANGDAVN
jgi:hypothetical protein